MTDHFSFRQFTIRHDRCGMRVGTDGVLLGAWARGGRRVVDIGSGTGLVALMLAQRYPAARVDGVEIDPAAVDQSRENVAASPFARRVRIVEGAFQTALAADEPPGEEDRYDAVVSNPPYFLDGMLAPDRQRAVARHASASFFTDLFAWAKRWLTACGELSLVLPAGSLEAVETEAYLMGFRLSRRLLLHTTPAKPVGRCLVAFARERYGEAELGEEALLAADGSRTAWYRELTAEFYLNEQNSEESELYADFA